MFRSLTRFKRLPQAILLLLLAFTITGCSNNKNPTVTEQVSPSPRLNFIGPYEPNPENKPLIDLLCPGARVNLFSFDVDNDYKSISISYDQYKNGILTYSSNPIKCDFEDQFTKAGRLAIIFDSKTIKISIKTALSGAASTYELTNNTSDDVDGGYWEETSSLLEESNIENQKEIALLAYVSNNEKTVLYPVDQLLDNSDKISEYDYCYIFTCSFSK